MICQPNKVVVRLRNLKLSPLQCVTLSEPCTPLIKTTSVSNSPATTPHNKHEQKRIIRSKPSEATKEYTFRIQKHVLLKRKTKLYLKCRITGCRLSYVTFHSVKNLNTHHRMYHWGVTFHCQTCNKELNTPMAFKWHAYTHGPLFHKCDKCDKSFIYSSKLRQHKRAHVTHKMFNCCYGGCTKRYQHPQDLQWHIATHTGVEFECDLCDKKFHQKRLLRCHEAVHSKELCFFCTHCNTGYKHQNQLFRHRQKLWQRLRCILLDTT